MALKGIAGSLAAGDLLEALAGSSRADVGALRKALAEGRRTLGPASGARQVFDLQLGPLLRALGLDVEIVRSDPAEVVGFAGSGADKVVTLAAGGWGSDLRRLRRRDVRGGGRRRWWIGCNGVTLRLMDGSRAYTRRTLDLDLTRLEDNDRSLAVVASLFDGAGAAPLATFESVVAASDRHAAAVGRSLQDGVLQALTRLFEAFGRGRTRSRSSMPRRRSS